MEVLVALGVLTYFALDNRNAIVVPSTHLFAPVFIPDFGQQKTMMDNTRPSFAPVWKSPEWKNHNEYFRPKGVAPRFSYPKDF